VPACNLSASFKTERANHQPKRKNGPQPQSEAVHKIREIR